MAGARRLVTLALGVALTAAPALARAQSAAPSASVRVTAALTACHPAPALSDRSATFEAQMNALAGTRTMQERFELQQSLPGQKGWHDVSFPAGSAPGFGSWQSSQPGITLLDNTQTVSGLAAPASYRVVVHYRWVDARRRAQRTAQRTTPVCRMPDERPNLIVRAVAPTAVPTRYAVVVRNGGPADAGPFQVTLSVGGSQPVVQSVPGLAAATSVLLSFTGPACQPGQSVTVVADPAGAVSETSQTDNTKTVTC